MRALGHAHPPLLVHSIVVESAQFMTTWPITAAGKAHLESIGWIFLLAIVFILFAGIVWYLYDEKI